MRLVITPLASVAGVFDLAYVLKFIDNFFNQNRFSKINFIRKKHNAVFHGFFLLYLWRNKFGKNPFCYILDFHVPISKNTDN